MYHCARDWMLGVAIDAGGEPDQLARAEPVQRNDIGELQPAQVSVPVLSNATAETRPAVSSWAPPLISTPARAAPVSPLTMVTGVEMTSAQGQAMTSKAERAIEPGHPLAAERERRNHGDQRGEPYDGRGVDLREAVHQRLCRCARAPALPLPRA